MARVYKDNRFKFGETILEENDDWLENIRETCITIKLESSTDEQFLLKCKEAGINVVDKELFLNIYWRK